jgi:hypothetical protein
VGDWTVTIVIKDNLGKVVETHDFSFNTKESDALILNEVTVCDTAPFGVAQCAPAGSLSPLIPFLRTVAPTDDVRVVPTGHQVKLPIVAGDPNGEPGDPNGDGDLYDCQFFPLLCEERIWWDTIIDDIAELFSLFDAFAGGAGSQQNYYYGMIRGVIPTSQGGQAKDITSRGAASLTSVMRHSGTVETNTEVVAHETGHMLNARHTNTNVPRTASAPGCYSTASDSATSWPFADNTIQSNPSSPTPEVGFDVMAIAANAIKLPDVHFETMSYCTPRWISPLNYRIILNILDPPPPLPQGDDGDFWLISGTVSEFGDTNLRPVFEFETLGLDDAGEGTHSIEVRDGSETVLFTRSFTPTSVERQLGLLPNSTEGVSVDMVCTGCVPLKGGNSP